MLKCKVRNLIPHVISKRLWGDRKQWGLVVQEDDPCCIKKNSTINPNKLICWEHPNFADSIVHDLEMVMGEGTTTLWPFCYTPFLDINLIVKFIYKK